MTGELQTTLRQQADSMAQAMHEALSSRTEIFSEATLQFRALFNTFTEGLARLSEQITRIKQLTDRLDVELMDVARQKEIQVAALISAQARLLEAERRLLEVENSLSWKLSAPVRWFGFGFRVLKAALKDVFRPLLAHMLIIVLRFPVPKPFILVPISVSPALRARADSFVELRSMNSPARSFNSAKQRAGILVQPLILGSEETADTAAARLLESPDTPCQAYLTTQRILEDVIAGLDHGRG